MNLDPRLLDVVVCPACRASLAADEAAEELVCAGCALALAAGAVRVCGDLPALLLRPPSVLTRSR